MDQPSLADFLEKQLVKDIQNKGFKSTFDFWITTLRSNSVCGSHDWRNLAGLISGYGVIVGENYRAAHQFCLTQAGLLSDMADKKG